MQVFKLIAITIILSLSSICKAQIIVKVRPVIPQRAVIIAPGNAPHGKFWIKGHWEVHGNVYIWRDGYYADLRPGYRYIEGRWVHRRKGWVWIPGRWRRGR